MSKSNQHKVKSRTVRDEQRRIEREWAYSEENEQSLEKLRNILIGVWLVCDLLLSVSLGDRQDIIVWAGVIGIALVIGYLLRSHWLEKVAEDRIDAEFGRPSED